MIYGLISLPSLVGHVVGGGQVCVVAVGQSSQLTTDGVGQVLTGGLGVQISVEQDIF